MATRVDKRREQGLVVDNVGDEVVTAGEVGYAVPATDGEVCAGDDGDGCDELESVAGGQWAHSRSVSCSNAWRSASYQGLNSGGVSGGVSRPEPGEWRGGCGTARWR
ncbi:hypothetical protein FRC09_017933 [Ceratobasidium sp. 395]|nr:hypothetical protein FRC09_017933 [Ceratobasidium sp. 395]